MGSELLRSLLLADYAQKAERAEEWQERAEFLLNGAAFLLQQYTQAKERPLSVEEAPRLLLCVVAPFLVAVGVEGLLKASIVKNHPDAAFEKGDNFYTHDLIKLAHRLPNFPLSSPEQILLRRLRHWIEWMGRYPIPKLNTQDPFLPQADSTGDVTDFNDHHWAGVVSFVQRLRTLLASPLAGN